MWDDAHDVAVKALAPEAVVCHDMTLLHELFERMIDKGVRRWTERGQVGFVFLFSPTLYHIVVFTPSFTGLCRIRPRHLAPPRALEHNLPSGVHGGGRAGTAVPGPAGARQARALRAPFVDEPARAAVRSGGASAQGGEGADGEGAREGD
jgi:hypothetical protein